MKVARFSAVALVVCLMAGTALGQPRGDRRGRGPGGPGGDTMGFGMLMSDDGPMKRMADAMEKLDLSSEQKDKLKALRDEYKPKFQELRDKAKDVLTDDQKSKLEDARKSLKDATGDDRRAAFRKFGEAMRDIKLSDEQKDKLKKIGQDSRSLIQEARPKFEDVLTDEQKKKLRDSFPGRGGRGGPEGRRGRGPGGGGDEGSDSKKEKEST